MPTRRPSEARTRPTDSLPVTRPGTAWNAAPATPAPTASQPSGTRPQSAEADLFRDLFLDDLTAFGRPARGRASSTVAPEGAGLPNGSHSGGGFVAAAGGDGTNSVVQAAAQPQLAASGAGAASGSREETNTLRLGGGPSGASNVAPLDPIPIGSGIADFVWNDSNRNGLQDTGESGLANVTVRLLNGSGQLLQTTLSTSTGGYGFGQLSAGSYMVEFVLPSGYQFTLRDQGGNDAIDCDADPTTGRTATITLGTNQIRNDVDAGMYLPNRPPVANNDSYTTSRSQTLSVNGPGLLTNDTDPDGNPLTATLVSNPTHGTLMQFGVDGSFTYLPDPNYTGTDTFTYKVNDGTLNSNVATVTITVTNATPVAGNDTYGVRPGTPLTIPAAGVLTNDTDADGGGLTAVLATSPTHGTLTLNTDGSFTYTPNAGYTGPDSFTYRANDGLANSAAATVSLNVHSANAAPVAAADSFTAQHNQTLTVAVPGLLGNDSDPDSDPLTAALVSGPAHGTLSLNPDGSFTYTPTTNYAGADSFTYKANDVLVSGNVVTVSLTVANYAPQAGDDGYTTRHDQVLTVAAPGLLANDTDSDGDPLTAVLVSGPAHGTLALNADGSFTYTPTATYSGADSFTYKANDGIANSSPITVALSVTDAAPVGASDYYKTRSGQALTVAAPGVLANDYDYDADSRTAVLVSNPANGTLNFSSNGSFTYTPNAGFVGKDTFTYRPSDGIVSGDSTTVTIAGTGANPIANNDEFATAKGQALTVAVPGVLNNDANYAGNALTAVQVSGPTNGILSLSPNGSFTYTPNAGFSGDDSFSYKASEVGLLSVLPAVVTIHVVGIDVLMTGVGAGQKLNPGGFVMINANNDNGSVITNEIPARREFNVSPLPVGVSDNDLVAGTINLTPNVALPGFFVLSTANTGTGRIQLWNNRNKGARVGGVYTSATLPRQFMVEGTTPSAALRENTITLQYFYINLFGIVTAAARDDIAVSVTPVVNFLDVNTQGSSVVFVGSRLPAPRTRNNGTLGMTTLGVNNNFAAALDAQVFSKGAAGNLVFIQNIGVPGAGGFPGIVNGFAGGPANAVTFTVGSGIKAGNYRFEDMKGRVVRETLDMSQQQTPPPPDYKGLFRQVPTGNPDLLQITAQDGPHDHASPGVSRTTGCEPDNYCRRIPLPAVSGVALWDRRELRDLHTGNPRLARRFPG